LRRAGTMTSIGKGLSSFINIFSGSQPINRR
jgi:hypothetical protein